jgi:PAS domain S-box-containing protein
MRTDFSQLERERQMSDNQMHRKPKTQPKDDCREEEALAVEELRSSHARFMVLTKNVDAGVALIDERGRFEIVNPAFLRLFDLPSGSDIRNVNDRDWAQWQVFDESGKLLDVDEHPIRKAAASGSAVRNRLVAVRSPHSAASKWVLISAEPILKPDGSVEVLVCTYHDVTERKQTEESLRTALGRLDAVLSVLYGGILLVSGDGRIVFANQAFCMQFHVTEPTATLVGITAEIGRASCRERV